MSNQCSEYKCKNEAINEGYCLDCWTDAERCNVCQSRDIAINDYGICLCSTHYDAKAEKELNRLENEDSHAGDYR